MRGLLPPSVTRTGNTLAGRIADQPGRLILARSATPAPGDGCVPQPITICVGPTVRATSLSHAVGEPFSFDAYAAVDYGDLHMGKAVTVSGLPSWATFDPATGLVTGRPTDTGDTSIIVSGTNAVGQSTSQQITLTKVTPAPVYAYQSWTGPGWFDFSDNATITTASGNIQTVANKRSGGIALTREGTTAITPVASVQNGRAVARFTRNAAAPRTAGTCQCRNGPDQHHLPRRGQALYGDLGLHPYGCKHRVYLGVVGHAQSGQRASDRAGAPCGGRVFSAAGTLGAGQQRCILGCG